MAARNKKPESQPINIVCSLCGMNWDAHGDQDDGTWKEPTTEDCIRLLKEELARRPQGFFLNSSNGYTGRMTYS